MDDKILEFLKSKFVEVKIFIKLKNLNQSQSDNNLDLVE